MFFPCSMHSIRKESGSLPNRFVWKIFHVSRVRISLSASARGSLTVEAACVLPVCLYAILAFLYFLQMLTMAGGVAEGLQDAGKQMAVYAYVQNSDGDEVRKKAGAVLNLLYARKRIRQAAGKEASSVSMLGSSILEEDEIIDLVASYRFRWRLPLFSRSVPVVQRARVRAWTGRESSETGEEEEKKEESVYITENGSVYHRDRECSHIRLSVRGVAKGQVGGLRNEDGGKYYPCESCGEKAGGWVYITDTGDRYHSHEACSRLKRSVIVVSLSQVEDWRPCSKCGR